VVVLCAIGPGQVSLTLRTQEHAHIAAGLGDLTAPVPRRKAISGQPRTASIRLISFYVWLSQAFGMSIGYEQDFFSWTQEQAAAIRAGDFSQLDREHLAGEIEEMGRSEQRALASRLAVIVAHLLKLQLQTERTPTNEKSWRNSVATQRRQVQRLLGKNPGLRNPAILADALESAWDDGRDWAIRETGLDPEEFPSEPIYDLAEILGESG